MTAQMGSSRYTHNELGDVLMREHHAAFIEGVPAIWENGQYALGQDAVYAVMIDLVHDITDRQRKEVMSYLTITAPHVDMGSPNLIAFKNGVLDIASMELHDNKPELLIPNTIPHNWNEAAGSDILNHVLNQWACGDLDVRRNIEETIGLAMYRGRELAVSPILIGEGANGKSTFLNFLVSMVGSENASALDLGNIGKRFQSVALAGKLVNIGDDISSERIKQMEASVVKKAISGDPIHGEYKHGASISLRPYCSMIFSCNVFPKIADTTSGMYRRLFPIPFGADFLGNEATANLGLAAEIDNEQTYEYAIALGISALKGCLDRGGFSVNEAQKESKRELIQQNSPVYNFCCDALGYGTAHAGSIAGTPTGQLFDEYVKYSNTRSQHLVNRNKFTIEMSRLYRVEVGKRYIKQPDGTTKQVRCFVQAAENG